MVEPNMIGAYGPWAAGLAGNGPARMSLCAPVAGRIDLDTWRAQGRARVHECLRMPDAGGVPSAEVLEQREYDGLHVEHLRWQLLYGPPTEALFLKPAGARDPLPAVLALHDHSGDKYFGHRKIAHQDGSLHPLMARHRATYYGGVSWANELAQRGYAVLAPDAFAFASRRVRLADVPPVLRGDLTDVDPKTEPEEQITAYNRFAATHEPVLARSLFCAGTTWPGVWLAEDLRALDYLCSRPDVDAARIGCAGLSGGGLRTAYLAGLDDRIACACVVGMMTTWRDFLLNTSYTHTWMIYLPGLPPDLDYPEIVGLRAPRPVLAQFDEHDRLFTLPEMRRADQMLAEVYDRAGAPDHYRGSFYPGPHRFDRPMQAEAFTWFDRWLGH